MTDDEAGTPDEPGNGKQAKNGAKIWVPDDASLPPRPLLQCPECDYGNDEPDQLALHLLQAHAYSEAQAWFVAGQENERLYPRYRAPEGTFTVLAVDLEHSRGKVVSHCATLEQAVQLAHQLAPLYPSVSVYDEAGHEVYQSKPSDQAGMNSKPD